MFRYRLTWRGAVATFDIGYVADEDRYWNGYDGYETYISHDIQVTGISISPNNLFADDEQFLEFLTEELHWDTLYDETEAEYLETEQQRGEIVPTWVDELLEPAEMR
ncbi:MAG: hypothetical protein V1792_28780 [Pseudomonadota bacterium]